MDTLKDIQEFLINKVYDQVMEHYDCVNARELGEVVDIIKDISETAYYHALVESMEHNNL